MSESWIEVETAKKEARFELVLSGLHINERLAKSGLDSSIFKLTNINYLEISKTCLASIPDELGNLVNLTRLVLHSNKLSVIPNSIGKLHKLKNLDLSFNELTAVPSEIFDLAKLLTINISNNKLVSCGSLAKLPNVTLLNVSNNCLEKFPDVCYEQLIHLTEVKARCNKIVEVPTEITYLSATLKTLDLEENCLTSVPYELSEVKLRDLNLKGNNFKDRRFKKLVEQCGPKQVLDYIRQHVPKMTTISIKDEKNDNQLPPILKKKKGKTAEIQDLVDELQILHVTDSVPNVISTEDVKNVRPYIVCCVARNVDLGGNNMKKFLALQTKLHETDCNKRAAATIATHDLAKVVGDVTFTARLPGLIKMIPLMRQTESSAADLFRNLQREAEALRKEKKKASYSGIHKFLYLLEGKELFPCLLDSLGERVISFPPITNADCTKMTSETTDLFLEITSSTSLNVCKGIMDSLVKGMVQLKLGGAGSTKDNYVENNGQDGDSPVAVSSKNRLVIQQVKVVDKEGNLKVVYPSRTDLQFEDVRVIREFE